MSLVAGCEFVFATNAAKYSKERSNPHPRGLHRSPKSDEKVNDDCSYKSEKLNKTSLYTSLEPNGGGGRSRDLAPLIPNLGKCMAANRLAPYIPSCLKQDNFSFHLHRQTVDFLRPFISLSGWFLFLGKKRPDCESGRSSPTLLKLRLLEAELPISLVS